METQFTLTLPTSADPFGRWLQAHGGNISISCFLGRWSVTIAWCVVVSHSDSAGTHRETWEVERSDRDLAAAVLAAVAEAMRQTAGAP